MKIQSLAFYQPENVIASRLPGGPDTLGAYIESLMVELELHYRSLDFGPTSRALVVAIYPDGCAFWLMKEDGIAPETSDVRGRLVAVREPGVLGGPVAFAIVFNLGQDFPVTSGPPLPSEWRDVLHDAGQPLQVDDILARLRE